MSGADLIRRKEGQPAFALTFSLLTTSEGTKMGKTAKGAVWLDPEKTSPYDFYQYWRNVHDNDVEKCMKLLTFMPVDEIMELTAHKDERMNKAKIRLAYEVTKIVHGEEIANQVQSQVAASFSNDSSNMPKKELSADITNICDILVATGLTKSRGEARRLVDQGGVKVNEDAVSSNYEISDEIKAKGEFVLHKGKKVHLLIEIK